MAFLNALPGAVAEGLIWGLWLFFYTEVGLTIKSTGDNPDMSRAQGINVNFNKVLGLAISNGIVALSGALLAQYKGSANINDGRGAIVIGLATLELGLETRLSCKVGLLSGGQRQAVTLLMATLKRPKLLLLDDHPQYARCHRTWQPPDYDA